MEHLTSTPFGRRPVTADLVARAAANKYARSAEPQSDPVEKWQIFRDLSAARQRYELSDRTLLVLNALLSFHQEKTLSAAAPLIVFPSNLSLSERAHGMAESTLRRHLSRLVEAGLIDRHDSPNGKRYARRRAGGEIARAFGFDLRPLVLRAPEIQQEAAQCRAARAKLQMTRERISLLKRDALKLATYAQDAALPSQSADWADVMHKLANLHTRLRRKLPLGDLQKIETKLVDILTHIKTEIEPKTKDLNGSDSETERHYQNSDKDSCESESTEEKKKPATTVQDKTDGASLHNPIPLPIVINACPDILPYCDRPPSNWRDLINAAAFVHRMIGISPSAWEEACVKMGPQAAATTIACILQRFTKIRNPGGYLRHLSEKAETGLFSTGPMVMALLNTTEHSADRKATCQASD